MTGGSLPALTWHAIMEPIHTGLGFKPIPGVPVPADLIELNRKASGGGRDTVRNRGFGAIPDTGGRVGDPRYR